MTSADKPIRKQAVLFVHGMGEQIPMETLRSFVEVVWVKDKKLVDDEKLDPNTGKRRHNNPIWSKPDKRNRSFELRRITTETAKNELRTDFYEFYWAHLMQVTTWEHFKIWFGDLLWRWPNRVPKDVFPAWIMLWVISLIVATVALYSLWPEAKCNGENCADNSLWIWLKAVLGSLFTLIIGAFVNILLLKYFGDVARYVKTSPINVAKRQKIRDQGVELLETLMGSRDYDEETKKWATQYERIVVVSHSLGTMIAYDILKHTFARVNRSFKTGINDKQPKRDELETLLRDNLDKKESLDIDDFQSLQKECRKELNDQGNPWIISDFITMGSPLTHAEFLMAYDEPDMRRQQSERILPTCPPTLEYDAKTGLHHFTYWSDKNRKSKTDRIKKFRYPHHAAHFAYTRWTNIYSKSKRIFYGDIISGPLANHFDLKINSHRLQGIRDISVLPKLDNYGNRKGKTPFFTHTKYWSAELSEEEAPYHIKQLRNAMNLLNE